MATRDVRMRGFQHRATVAEAVAWVDAAIDGRVEADGESRNERVPLVEAAGRVLHTAPVARIDVPPFDRSAMDGYAVRAEETTGAGDYNVLSFRVVGESLPGRPSDHPVGPGTVVRIMTGAPIPDGATGVVPVEDARESDGTVNVTAAIPVGKHIGRRGEDVERGTTPLVAGGVLRPQDVGMLASIGVDRVDVVRRPRVRIVVTGDELVRPGDDRPEHAVYESNSFVLRALVTRDGGVLESLRDVPDDRDAIATAITESGVDVVLVSGGSSVGREDHAPSIVGERGDLAIHGVAMRPSSPAGMGTVNGTLVFLLPGNPVSCLCAYDFFSGRAVRGLGGRPRAWPYEIVTGALTRKIASVVGRTDYCRVLVTEGTVEPLALSGASMLSSTVRANGFVVVPAEREGFAPGDVVTVHAWGAAGPS